MRKKVFLFILILSIFQVFCFSSFRNPSFSPNGKYMLLTGEGKSGVYLYDVSNEALVRVTDGRSSGCFYNWAQDGKRFGFKTLIEREDGRFLQVPSVYDMERGIVVPLTEPVGRAGVPSFSNDGKTAFTVGETLIILDSSYEVMAEHNLGVYANLTPVSADGAKVVFNDDSDKLWLLDLKTSEKILLTSGEEGWFGPVWSPEGKRILCSSITGNLAVIEIASLSLVKIGRGSGYSWSPDGRNIIFSRYFGEIGKKITGSDIFMASADGKTTKKISASPSEFLMEPSLSLSGELVFFSEKTGKLQKTEPISNEAVEILIDGSRVKDAPASSTGHDAPRTEDQPPDTCISGVPYLHQVYDTPNWFNGNWACNATAAMMCVAYYDILPWWDCTVSVPWSHVSHYGNYVCEIYSFNGHTYDIASPDPNSNDAWGGYGYIVRNNWADTKGYMRDYFANHTMDYNGVDWSPTWEEYLSEIANNYPTVFLSLITESGHYTVGIGCVTGWHTAIFRPLRRQEHRPVQGLLRRTRLLRLAGLQQRL